MLYIDKEGRPHSRNICFINVSWDGSIGGGGTLGDLLDVAGRPDKWSGKTPETTSEGVAVETEVILDDVEDEEEAGDELRPKQGTDQGIPVIYGKRRVGGILVYQETSGDTVGAELMNLFQCWALCEGEVQGWEVFVDEQSLADSIYRLTDNSNYNVSYGRDWLIASNHSGDVAGTLGGTSLGSDAGITYPYDKSGIGNSRKVSGWSWGGTDNGETHRMKGIACEQLTYRHHWDGIYWSAVGGNVGAFGPGENADGTESEVGADVWKGGLPKLSFDVTGPVIKDNAGTTKSSTDPAWILYDYLTNPRYGCRIPADEIDTASFVLASSICGETTTGGVAHSGTKRHECNIILETLQPLITNVKRILATCNGQLNWINGLYTMKIENIYAGSGEFNFLEKHIIGGISIVGGSVGNRLNQVTAKFINPDKKWKSDEVRYPDKNNDTAVYDTFLSDDNDVKHTKTLNVGGVTNLNQARYLAKQACLRSRDGIKASFSSTAEAMNVVVGDVVTITHSTPGWSAKEFIVKSLTLNADGSCSLSCIEHNDAIYAWDDAVYPAESPNTILPDPRDVTAPIGLLVEETVYSSIASAGKRVSVQLDWTSTGIFTTSHDVEYKLSTATSWINAGSTVSKSMLLQDFSLDTFDFRVRARNAVGSTSDWLVSTGVLIEGITTAPENVTGLVVTNHGDNVIITIDPPVDAIDISHCQVSILQEDSTLLDDAVEVAQIAVGNTSTVIPAQEGTYAAIWVNSSGTQSNDYSSSGAVTSYGSSSVATFPEQPAWLGTMDGFYEVTVEGVDVLRFLGGALWDTVTEPMDSWGTLNGLGGRTEPATYTGVKRDLGAVLPARIHTNKIFTSLVTDGSNYMDYWGKSDLRTSWDPVSKLDNLTVQVRVTEDDPASLGATWSNYKDFLIIDVVARGLQIKVTFDEFDENSQFTLQELELLIDMVQKFESDRAKTATSITYDTEFFTVPDLVVTPTNMVSGEYMAISSETKAGFNVNFYNSLDVAQTRSYNYIANGV